MIVHFINIRCYVKLYCSLSVFIAIIGFKYTHVDCRINLLLNNMNSLQKDLAIDQTRVCLSIFNLGKIRGGNTDLLDDRSGQKGGNF